MSQYYINPTTAVAQPASFTHIPESVRRQMESEADRRSRYTGLHGSQGYRVNIERAKHEHRSARTNDSSQVFSALDMDANLAHQRHVEQMFSCQPSQQPMKHCQLYGYSSTIHPAVYSPPIPLPVADAEKDHLRARVCALEAQLRALTVQAQEQGYAGRDVEFKPAVCQYIPSHPVSAPAAVSSDSPPQTVRFSCTHTPAAAATTAPAPAHMTTELHGHEPHDTPFSRPQDAQINGSVVEPPSHTPYPPLRGRTPSRMAWPPIDTVNAPPTRAHAQRSRSATRARAGGVAEVDMWLTSSEAAAQEVMRATSRGRRSLTPAQEHALVARLYRQPPTRAETGTVASAASSRQPFRPPGTAAPPARVLHPQRAPCPASARPASARPASRAVRLPTHHAGVTLSAHAHARVPPTLTSAATCAHAIATPARPPSPRATAPVAPALFPVAADVISGQCGVLDPRALDALLPAQEPPHVSDSAHVPPHCPPLPDATVVAAEYPQPPHVRLPLPVSVAAVPEAGLQDAYGDLRAATARNKQRNTTSSVFSHTAPADVSTPKPTAARAAQHTYATTASTDAPSAPASEAPVPLAHLRDRNRDRNRASSAFAFADGAEPARLRSRTPAAMHANPHARVGTLGQSVYEQTMGAAPAAVGVVCRQQRATLLANRARNLSSSAFAEATQAPEDESQLQPPLGSPTRRCAPVSEHELANHAAHTARARAASIAAISANRERSLCSSSVADALCPRPVIPAGHSKHRIYQGQGNVFGASSSNPVAAGAVHIHHRPHPTSQGPDALVAQRVARECLDRGVVLGFAALPPSPPPQPLYAHMQPPPVLTHNDTAAAHHDRAHHICASAPCPGRSRCRSPPPFDVDPTLDAFADAEAERRLRSAPPLPPLKPSSSLPVPAAPRADPWGVIVDLPPRDTRLFSPLPSALQTPLCLCDASAGEDAVSAHAARPSYTSSSHNVLLCPTASTTASATRPSSGGISGSTITNSCSSSAHNSTASRAHTQHHTSALVLRRHQLKRALAREAAAGNSAANATLLYEYDALCRAPPVSVPEPPPVAARAPANAPSRQPRSMRTAAHPAAYIRGPSAAGLGVASMAFTVAGPSTLADGDTQPLPPAALDVSAAHMPIAHPSASPVFVDAGAVTDTDTEAQSTCTEAARTRLQELLGSLVSHREACAAEEGAASTEAIETGDNAEAAGDGGQAPAFDSWWEVEDENNEETDSEHGCINEDANYCYEDVVADGSLQLEALLREAEATLAEAQP